MTPMLDCALSVTIALLAASGRTATLAVAGRSDEVASWCRSAFRWVDDPEAATPPPTEVIRLCQGGDVPRKDQLTAWACTLALVVWSTVDDQLAPADIDVEGDSSPEEHDEIRRRRLAEWSTKGRAAALAKVEEALSEALPKMVKVLVTA